MISGNGHGHSPEMALIIESDPLTVWSIKSYLTASYEVLVASSYEDALPYLADPQLSVIICGTPLVDRDPRMLEQIARNPRHTIIALVSDVGTRLPSRVVIVEKPFALEQLARVLHAHGSLRGS